MMLRLRSRAATLMADRSSHQSPPPTPTPHTNQIPSLLSSPRLRALFAAGAHSTYYPDQPEASPTTAISPTSVLLPFSAAALGSPVRRNPPPPTTVTKPPCRQSSDLGLNSLIILENSGDDVSKFRPNLTVRIPVVPDSPTEFGTKTWNSPKPRKKPDQDVPPQMELSEEYTCVISHGPNPTTTHIFDDRIVVESSLFYLSDDDYNPTTRIALTKVNDPRSSESFLTDCFTCRKSLKQNQDIYIYRGDKAFCSSHCRYQEMVFDGARDEARNICQRGQTYLENTNNNVMKMY